MASPAIDVSLFLHTRSLLGDTVVWWFAVQAQGLSEWGLHILTVLTDFFPGTKDLVQSSQFKDMYVWQIGFYGWTVCFCRTDSLNPQNCSDVHL